MSDEDYEAFLNKANEDVSGTKVQSKSQSIGIKAVNTEVPKALEKVEEIYVSDADEPFEPVALKYQGDSLPSTGKSRRTSISIARMSGPYFSFYFRRAEQPCW
jgi:hypothetical protein